jgi:Putative prokaryotic signal transducing protein
MKTVRTFANLAEAGFASSLLQSVGILASLTDEQCFLMTPGMATGGIRLQVEDPDFERAARVLAEGPDAVVPRADDSQVSADEGEAHGGIPVAVFVAVAVVFGLMVFSVRQAAENRRTGPRRATEQTYEYDENHDGRPDRFLVYRNEVLARAEMDRNADGRIDSWETYDHEGGIERVEQDDNFDGRPDVWYSYKNGRVVSSRNDTDFDGRPDWFGTYENGIVVRMDCRPNESSIVVRRDVHEHGVLREEWVDENQDGVFDYKIPVDPFGVRSDRIPIQSAK